VDSNNGRPPAEAAVGVNVAADNTSVLLRCGRASRPKVLLAAALAYADVGVAVFPLGRSKRPLALCEQCSIAGACPGRDQCCCAVNTCHGFYAATTDAGTITDWWGQNPAWQLGIRTGQPSGLAVLDVDVDKGGLDSLIRLERAGFAVAGATVQLSGSGRSFHLMYGHPGVHLPCSQGALGAGLDVRGDGGYVVGAPSKHAATGAPYEMLGILTTLPKWPLRVRPSRAPREAGAHVRRVSGLRAGLGDRLTSSRLEALIKTVRHAPVGQRRSTLFWAACRLGECAGRRGDLVRAADGLLLAAKDSGLDAAEAYATVLDGVREGRRS